MIFYKYLDLTPVPTHDWTCLNYAYRALTEVGFDYRSLTGRGVFGGQFMPTARISKRSVDALNCPTGKDREFLWDEDLAGFGVAAFPTGAKAYVIQFRKDGRTRRSRIGLHGRLSPDEARSIAKKLLGRVEEGIDPIAERKAARAVPTFAQVSTEFMEAHVRAKRKHRTASEYQRLLDRRILTVLGARRITTISRLDVAKLHQAVCREAPVSANRVVALVSSIWMWAGRRGVVELSANPASRLERTPERGRERYLTPLELSRLGDTLSEAETVGLPFVIDRNGINAKFAPKTDSRRLIDPHALAAIKLLILTGARIREILHARWTDVDQDRGMIHLADSKTGRKPIYLNTAALEVLNSISKTSNPYVIPGYSAGSPRADLNRPWRAIRKAAGLNDIRIHDLRHSFASIGAGASLGLPVIGRLLGHSQPGTTARYAHLDSHPILRAAETIGSTIAAAMNGENLKETSRGKPAGRS